MIKNLWTSLSEHYTTTIWFSFTVFWTHFWFVLFAMAGQYIQFHNCFKGPNNVSIEAERILESMDFGMEVPFYHKLLLKQPAYMYAN